MAGVAKSMLEGGLALGRMASGTQGPLKSWRTSRLQAIFAARTSLRLQFPREDLGFCYSGSHQAAIIPGSPPGPGCRPETALRRDRHAPFVPSAAPGCRMPHCWLRLVGPQQGIRMSTLDFPALNGGSWVLFQWCTRTSRGVSCVHHGQQLPAWLVTVCVTDKTDATGMALDGCPASVYVAVDEAEVFENVMHAVDGAAILVRPDGHVAWQSQISHLRVGAALKCNAEAQGSEQRRVPILVDGLGALGLHSAILSSNTKPLRGLSECI